MDAVFYIAAAVAILATIMVITRLNAVHALLYLIVSLLSVAVVFYHAGCSLHRSPGSDHLCRGHHGPFRFCGHDAQLGRKTIDMETNLANPRMWMGPCILTVILIAEVAYLLFKAGTAAQGAAAVVPKAGGHGIVRTLRDWCGTRFHAFAGALVGAYHLGVGKARTTGDSRCHRFRCNTDCFWRGSCSPWDWSAFSCGVI